MNKLLIQATIWMDCKCYTNERTRHKKLTLYDYLNEFRKISGFQRKPVLVAEGTDIGTYRNFGVMGMLYGMIVVVVVHLLCVQVHTFVKTHCTLHLNVCVLYLHYTLMKPFVRRTKSAKVPLGCGLGH